MDEHICAMCGQEGAPPEVAVSDPQAEKWIRQKHPSALRQVLALLGKDSAQQTCPGCNRRPPRTPPRAKAPPPAQRASPSFTAREVICGLFAMLLGGGGDEREDEDRTRSLSFKEHLVLIGALVLLMGAFFAYHAIFER